MAASWDLQVSGNRGGVSGDAQLARALRQTSSTYLAVELQQGTRDTANVVRTIARGTLDAAPGRYSKSKTQLAARGDTVALVAPWAPGAEWGSNTHHVFGRKTIDRWGIWAPRVRPGPDAGYVLGAAWRIWKAKALARMREAGRDAVRAGMAANGIVRAGGTLE